MFVTCCLVVLATSEASNKENKLMTQHLKIISKKTEASLQENWY